MGKNKPSQMIPGEYYEINYSYGSRYTVLCLKHTKHDEYEVQTYTSDGNRREITGTVTLNKMDSCRKISKVYALTLQHPENNEEALSLLTKESIL